MRATHQSKHMQKSTCRVYSALTVLWQASWTPPVQKPQPGGTWHSSTLKGCSRYTSSHGRCKPDAAGKIVISLPWQCFFRLYSDVLPRLQLNHVKGSCSQPRGWLSHSSPRAGATLPSLQDGPALLGSAKGRARVCTPYPICHSGSRNTSTGRVLRSLGCILTETDWVAPTYTATGSDATAGEG